MRRAWLLAALLLPAAPGLRAGFDSGGGAASEASVPQICEAGDVPTAYAYARHELRSDVRFYGGGGILAKAHFGIFPRFSLGGGLDVPGLIGAGSVSLTREDAQLSTRLLLLMEDEAFPSVSLGYDGPAYAGGQMRGLYLALSKEFRTPLGFFQAHGGANSEVFEGFQAGRDLRGFGALTTTFRQLTLFAEADEVAHPAGPRLNAGGRIFFDPISLGVEFQDLGGARAGIPVTRLLRVSYTGLF